MFIQVSRILPLRFNLQKKWSMSLKNENQVDKHTYIYMPIVLRSYGLIFDKTLKQVSPLIERANTVVFARFVSYFIGSEFLFHSFLDEFSRYISFFSRYNEQSVIKTNDFLKQVKLRQLFCVFISKVHNGNSTITINFI